MGLIVAAIAVATATGVWSQRRYGASALDLSRSMLLFTLWVVLPPVTFINLVDADLRGDAWLGILGGLASMTLLGYCAWFVGTRVLRLPRPSTGALICSVVVANTGYLGYPMVAALLGFEALGEAVAYDILVAGPMMIVGSFAVGAAFGADVGAQARATARERVLAFFTRNPLVITAILALAAPDIAIPEALLDLSRVLVIALLPIGFFTVGVALADSASRQRDTSAMRRDPAVIAAVALRVVGGPILLYAITAPFIDLPDTYLLLSAMPCGVGTMMVAYAYGLDARLAARAIAWSTLIVVACFAVGGLVL